MRFGALLAVAALGLVTLGGCAPTYPNCKSDDNCKEHNEVCVQGQCQECAENANCKAGFICQGNKCVPKPECTSDSACPSGQHCQAGKCTSACTQDAECGKGKCHNGACVAHTCTTQRDCPGGQDCEEGVCVASSTAGCNWAPVHFGFNEVNLTPEVRQQLDTLVQCIKGARAKVTLEGHADERGTEEYNLQLSNRRAASVKKYLGDLGVAASQLDAVGFGSTRPVSSGHSEDAWGANRRVEFHH